MGDLTKHFSRKEFECRCCGEYQVDPELLQVLEDVRTYFDSPVKINSAYRCPKHNEAVGGEPKSQHMEGTAADITVESVSPKLVADYLEKKYPDKYGIGRYERWTHIDVRKSKARWRK